MPDANCPEGNQHGARLRGQRRWDNSRVHHCVSQVGGDPTVLPEKTSMDRISTSQVAAQWQLGYNTDDGVIDS